MTKAEEQEIIAVLDKHTRELESILAEPVAPAVIPAPKPEPVILRGKCADYGLEDSNRDILEDTAFCTWLQKGENVPVLFNHFEHLVAGETISFENRKDGLYVALSLDMNSPVGRDMNRLVKRGAINALSISFRYHPKIGANTYNDDCAVETIRIANSVTEISLACYPIGRRTMLEGCKEKECTWQEYKERLFNGILIEHKLETPEIRNYIQREYNTARDNFFAGNVIIH